MDDWDNDEGDIGVNANQWKNEDGEADSDWDNDETEKKPAAPAKPPPIRPKKKTFEEIQAEKREKKRAEIEQEKARMQQEREMKEGRPDAKAEAEMKRQAEESELLFIQESLGDAIIKDATVAADKKTLDNFEPASKDDFRVFNDLLKAKITKYNKSPFYQTCLETLFREVTSEINVEGLRSFSSIFSLLANEKAKALQAKKKKGVKSKMSKVRDNDFGNDLVNEEDIAYEDDMDGFF